MDFNFAQRYIFFQVTHIFEKLFKSYFCIFLSKNFTGKYENKILSVLTEMSIKKKSLSANFTGNGMPAPGI